MIGAASLHGELLPNGVLLHLRRLHTDHPEEGLACRPFHEHVVQFD
jgi:hypothetical protein